MKTSFLTISLLFLGLHCSAIGAQNPPEPRQGIVWGLLSKTLLPDSSNRSVMACKEDLDAAWDILWNLTNQKQLPFKTYFAACLTGRPITNLRYSEPKKINLHRYSENLASVHFKGNLVDDQAIAISLDHVRMEYYLVKCRKTGGDCSRLPGSLGEKVFPLASENDQYLESFVVSGQFNLKRWMEDMKLSPSVQRKALEYEYSLRPDQVLYLYSAWHFHPSSAPESSFLVWASKRVIRRDP